MQYILLLDKNRAPLVCELNHHIQCHNKEDFKEITVIDAGSLSEADEKAGDFLEKEDIKYQLSLFVKEEFR